MKRCPMAGGGAFPDSFLCSDEAEALERHPGTEPLHLELHALRSQLESTVSPGGLIGVSLRMRTIHNLIGKARNHTFPVLILGETGTGKELVARCIHYSGSRKHAAFVAVDCSSLTPTLIESELFGHMRGAGRAIVASSLLGLLFGKHPTDHGMHTLASVMVVLSAALVIATVADRTLPCAAVPEMAS